MLILVRLKQKFAIPMALVAVLAWTAIFSAAQGAPENAVTASRPEVYKGRTLAQWTSLIEATPSDPQLYYSRAILHSIRDERTNAVDDLTQALKLKPDYLEALRERATINVLLANVDKAAEDADLGIKLDPDSPRSYETRGWIYDVREQYTQAIADWQHALSLEDTGYYRYHLAQIYLKLARFDEAKEEIDQAIEMDKNGYIAGYRGVAGVIATFTRDYELAQSQLKKSTEAIDARGVEWQELAYYDVCTHKLADAEAAMQRAKTLETFPARAFRLAGELDRTAGRFQQAIQEFSSSTSLEEYPPGYRERAVTYISLGQWQSAYMDLVKSLQLNKYSNTTLSYLAMVENRLGKKDESKQHMDQAFATTDIPPIVYVNRATVDLVEGNYKIALDDANKAITMDPFIKEGYAVRAKIKEKLKDTAAAKTDQTKADSLVSHLDL